MTIEYYHGHDSYLIYAEDSAWGTSGTPSVSNKITKTTNISVNMNNNFIRSQGIGDGRNATTAVLGGFDVNGTIEVEPDDFTFMQYAIGTRSGAGTSADPYELKELDNIGYDATNIPSITLEIGSEGDSNDDVLQIDGVVFNNLQLNLNQGETLKASVDWIGRSVTSSTTLESYSSSNSQPFVFQNGSVSIGAETFACTQFQMSLSNNITTHRDLGSRFIAQPATGLRRYDFTLTFKMKYDNTASTLSGTELRDYFYGSSNSPATSGSVTAYALNVSIDEGSSSGDRIVDFDLENCYFESWSEPVPLEGGFIEVTVNGFGLAGKTDSTDHVPIRWYSIS